MSGASIFDVLAIFAATVTIVALLVTALVVGYRYSLKRHPYTDCRRCEGTGERRSRLFAHSYGHCPDCTGTGRKIRLGARLLNVR
ncbi:hypothetical protein ACIBKY_39170 [Nonomuraea sp. NPDC050394]|uniref:hypothetical protein n=1 Tax=Nonomuraea sp. NPDC050394 TaxID=3364363 RepID=UPI0037A3DF00